MKRIVLTIIAVALFQSYIGAQTLYNNSTQTGFRFNPKKGSAGTPIIAFDDINIDSARVGNTDSIDVKKVNVGIRMLAGAPAVTVKIYYTPIEDTATSFGNLIKLPPVLIGTVNLPANTGTTGVTAIASAGDSINTLFTAANNMSALLPGYASFFIGVSLSDTAGSLGWRFTSGPDSSDNVVWLNDADSTVKRFATFFGAAPNPTAEFYVQVYGQGRPLPITLSSFTGERSGSQNMLLWTTQSESNNRGYELQRSADGRNFTTVAFVDSKAPRGNSSSTLNYSYGDAKPLSGNNYYRLRQVDFDGHSSFSKTVLIKGDRVNTLTLSTVYPNPAKSSLNVVLDAASASEVSMTVTDAAGKVVLQRTVSAVAGSNNYTLNVSSLAKGNYVIKASGANKAEAAAVKFVKD